MGACAAAAAAAAIAAEATNREAMAVIVVTAPKHTRPRAQGHEPIALLLQRRRSQ
jgi:cobalamin biosynthesis protein CbiD